MEGGGGVKGFQDWYLMQQTALYIIVKREGNCLLLRDIHNIRIMKQERDLLLFNLNSFRLMLHDVICRRRCPVTLPLQPIPFMCAQLKEI